MKTLIQSLLVAVSFGLVSASAAQATTVSADRPTRPAVVSAYQTGIHTTAEGKLNIALDKEKGGRVVVKLTNSAGKVFFTEQVGKRQSGTRLRLDVSGLPDGVYQVAISNGVETTTHALTLATQQPSVNNRLVAVN